MANISSREAVRTVGFIAAAGAAVAASAGFSPKPALAKLSMSVVALMFDLALQSFSGIGRFLVNASLYAVVVVALALMWRTHGIVIESPNEAEVSQACGRVASERGLTPRETEVFPLLAQSRSRVFIQEQLGLSDSTTRAYTGHIYQKLDVHSKQGLISLARERG